MLGTGGQFRDGSPFLRLPGAFRLVGDVSHAGRELYCEGGTIREVFGEL